jgi:hypothetical protein
VNDDEIHYLRQSAREGWRYADELEQERKRLTGEAAVLRSLLRECDAVLAIVETENDDEAEHLARLRQQIGLAIGEAKGTLL